MRSYRLATSLWAGAMCLAGALFASPGQAQAPASPESAATATAVVAPLANDTCLGCHAGQTGTAAAATGPAAHLFVDKGKFRDSAHGKRTCVECHAGVTEAPHKAGTTRAVTCVTCHDALWNAAKAANKAQENPRLGFVVQRIDHYVHSIHAHSNRDDPSRVNATCTDCHAPHEFAATKGPQDTAWRLTMPNVCGKCHVKELAQYATSVHGKKVLTEKNPVGAICSDCHTTHDVADPTQDAAKLAITKNCGGCHAANLKTYTDTYHGKVNTLGYAYTAKCFDCHGNHAIQKVNDPASSVFPDNRLKTCQKCHTGATPAFTSFEPHGTPHDINRYPVIWLASKFVLLILGGMLAFFWSHAALWFYREYKERNERKSRPHVTTTELPGLNLKGRHYQRFPLIWRLAHLTSAISLMMLTLTGMSVLYADTKWAPVVIHWLGGPRIEAVVHRTFAVLFIIVLVSQAIYFISHVIRNRGTFEWFGPNSLVPRLQDLWDIIAMFRWFFGRGPRPAFDRWTYWQKFDYWAPLSVISIIITCGLMLWAPTVTARLLPGWAFNVATIFHGEGALLAVLFLFTVHFFNNHFRPDKFPLDVDMFTGSMPLERFRNEHRVEYNRLLASGELEQHLVDAPSRPMTIGSTILGFAMILFGLILLAFVIIGIVGNGTGF